MSNWSSRSGCEFVWKFCMAIFCSFIMRWGWYRILHCENCYTSWNLCSKMSKMWSILLRGTVKIHTLIKIVYIKIQNESYHSFTTSEIRIVCLCQKLSREKGPSHPGEFYFCNSTVQPFDVKWLSLLDWVWVPQLFTQSQCLRLVRKALATGTATVSVTCDASHAVKWLILFKE